MASKTSTKTCKFCVMENYDIYCSLIILYNENGEILLQHRTDDAKTMPGFWAFFGGGIKEGETPLQAVVRETKEELGYSLKGPKLFLEQEFALGNKMGYMFVYIEKYDGTKLVLNEGQGMGWFDNRSLNNLKIIEHDKRVMFEVLEYIENYQ